MLAAAREAWEASGYRVHGAALSGKAAEGLEEASGIGSRTLASWSLGWESGRGLLGQGDVLVIDEAGMIGSRQLAPFIAEAEARGAKLVLVGDHEQLQAIGAGAPFRAIAEEIGHAGLSDIRGNGKTGSARPRSASPRIGRGGSVGLSGAGRHPLQRDPIRTRGASWCAIIWPISTRGRRGRGSPWRIGAPMFGR
jgi:hypothetical protein